MLHVFERLGVSSFPRHIGEPSCLGDCATVVALTKVHRHLLFLHYRITAAAAPAVLPLLLLLPPRCLLQLLIRVVLPIYFLGLS